MPPIIREKKRKKRNRDLEDLPLKFRQFVHILMKDPNFDRVRAAEELGFARPAAASRRIMADPRVQAYLGNELKNRLDRTRLTADRILEEISYCALRDPADLCDENGQINITDLRKLPERARRAIDHIKQRAYVTKEGDQVLEVELRMVPKIVALEMAAKHFGLLNPKDSGEQAEIDWDAMLESSEEDHDPIEESIATAPLPKRQSKSLPPIGSVGHRSPTSLLQEKETQLLEEQDLTGDAHYGLDDLDELSDDPDDIDSDLELA